MRKPEIETIVSEIKAMDESRIKDIVMGLEVIADEKELTKSMYFWGGGTSAGTRRGNEKKYNREIVVDMGSKTITYTRDYRETCNHVYAKDAIKDEAGKTVTIADIKKIIAGIIGKE